MKLVLWRYILFLSLFGESLLQLSVPPSRFKKGIFCEACDLLKMRYCYEQRCDRSHFCFKTETASGCSNPYMHTIHECRSMHHGDCCFARQDLHGKRFNTTSCIHKIPEIMCHSCTRLEGCQPISCEVGNVCYANRFESGCANTTSLQECSSKHERCCEGRTRLKSWNATECQAEAAPTCEICPQQPLNNKLDGCTSATCPGLCFLRKFNVTTKEKSGRNRTTEHIETGCSPTHLDVLTCNKTHQKCCTSANNTDCYHNYNPSTLSSEIRFFIAFFLILTLMGFVLCLCFSENDER